MEQQVKKYEEYCCVPGCKNESNEKRNFHRPPKDKKLFKKWWIALKIKTLTPNMRVCNRHFLPENYFKKSGDQMRNILKKNVIPSQNLSVTLLTSKKKNVNLQMERQMRSEERNNKKIKMSYVNSSVYSDPVSGSNSEKDLHTVNNKPLIEEIDCSNNESNVDSSPDNKKTSSVTCDKFIQVNFSHFNEINNSDEIKTSVRKKETFFEFLDTDEKLYSFTGIKSHKLLSALEECIAELRKTKNKKTVNMCIKNTIVLTFIKLKQNLTYTSLGVMFNISSDLCKKYFIKTLYELHTVLTPLLRWPSKDEIKENMPKCFKNFENTRVVLDCLEISAKQSKCLKTRITLYSNYKSQHTIKFMIGVTPSGLISYVSPAYGGRTSAKQMFIKSRLLEKTERSVDAIMVDRGFLIDRECAEYGVKLIRPPFLKQRLQLSARDAKLSAEIAAARVHVKQRIQRIRQFSILKGPLGTKIIPYINVIMRIICSLTNLSSPILGPCKFMNSE